MLNSKPGKSQYNRAIFEVPLSTQRYAFVQKFLEENPDIKTVTDLGCGNGRIMCWLKAVPTLDRINFVDQDYHLFEDQLDSYIRPNLIEMLFGRKISTSPLNVAVYAGDLTIPDDRVRADLITMVEVIEHMQPEDVECCTSTIFGYYKPKSVLITTPNREFNRLLRQEGESEHTFRHYDHKFEWTREEFAQWCQKVVDRYPYKYKLDGVGHLPTSEPFGPCTQIAIFTHNDAQHMEPVNQDSDEQASPSDNIQDGRSMDFVVEFLVPGCNHMANSRQDHQKETYDSNEELSDSTQSANSSEEDDKYDCYETVWGTNHDDDDCW